MKNISKYIILFIALSGCKTTEKALLKKQNSAIPAHDYVQGPVDDYQYNPNSTIAPPINVPVGQSGAPYERITAPVVPGSKSESGHSEYTLRDPASVFTSHIKPKSNSGNVDWLYIGDSLSSSGGKFSKNIMSAIKEGGESVQLYSISGAPLKWDGKNSYKYGAYIEPPQNNMGEVAYGTSVTVPDYEELLKKHHPKKVLFQLGTNDLELGEAGIKGRVKRLMNLAYTYNVQDCYFVMPPDTGNEISPDQQVAMNRAIQAAISESQFKGCKTFNSYSDNSGNVKSTSGTHFYNSDAETRWSNDVISWINRNNRDQTADTTVSTYQGHI